MHEISSDEEQTRLTADQEQMQPGGERVSGNVARLKDRIVLRKNCGNSLFVLLLYCLCEFPGQQLACNTPTAGTSRRSLYCTRAHYRTVCDYYSPHTSLLIAMKLEDAPSNTLRPYLTMHGLQYLVPNSDSCTVDSRSYLIRNALTRGAK
jgi:hypothetical protein